MFSCPIEYSPKLFYLCLHVHESGKSKVLYFIKLGFIMFVYDNLYNFTITLCYLLGGTGQAHKC